MKKLLKSEIKRKVNDELSRLTDYLKIEKPSSRTKKALARVSKALQAELKDAAKKQEKKEKKEKKSGKEKKSSSRKESKSYRAVLL